MNAFNIFQFASKHTKQKIVNSVYVRYKKCSRIQVLRSVLLADTSGYNLYPGYMYQV